MTDSLERTREEDRAWLDQLHRTYGTWLRACLVRRYGAQEAEDLLQETWLRVARLCRAGGILTPKAFLLRVASNLASGRRKRVEGTGEAEVGELGLSVWGVQESSQDETLLLKQVILSLPQPLRDVFVLSRYGGLTYEQIAEHLGISPKTVEWRMSKALAHCVAQLRR